MIPPIFLADLPNKLKHLEYAEKNTILCVRSQCRQNLLTAKRVPEAVILVRLLAIDFGHDKNSNS